MIEIKLKIGKTNTGEFLCEYQDDNSMVLETATTVDELEERMKQYFQVFHGYDPRLIVFDYDFD